MKYGLIAGNGRFPILTLEAARRLGHEVVAIGIEEEASPEIAQLAAKTYWISLGALSRLIEICKSEGIGELIMAGQVKHAKIFSAIRPDWRLAKLLFSLEGELRGTVCYEPSAPSKAASIHPLMRVFESLSY